MVKMEIARGWRSRCQDLGSCLPSSFCVSSFSCPFVLCLSSLSVSVLSPGRGQNTLLPGTFTSSHLKPICQSSATPVFKLLLPASLSWHIGSRVQTETSTKSMGDEQQPCLFPRCCKNRVDLYHDYID